jgi:hypothetical protein
MACATSLQIILYLRSERDEREGKKVNSKREESTTTRAINRICRAFLMHKRTKGAQTMHINLNRRGIYAEKFSALLEDFKHFLPMIEIKFLLGSSIYSRFLDKQSFPSQNSGYNLIDGERAGKFFLFPPAADSPREV